MQSGIVVSFHRALILFVAQQLADQGGVKVRVGPRKGVADSLQKFLHASFLLAAVILPRRPSSLAVNELPG